MLLRLGLVLPVRLLSLLADVLVDWLVVEVSVVSDVFDVVSSRESRLESIWVSPVLCEPIAAIDMVSLL
jgi:hypothetical protein